MGEGGVEMGMGGGDGYGGQGWKRGGIFILFFVWGECIITTI